MSFELLTRTLVVGKVGVVIPIVQVGHQRCREVETLDQGHTADFC